MVGSAVAQLKQFYDRFLRTETVIMVSLALLVGVITGLGAVFFRWLVHSFQGVFFEGGEEVLSFMGRWYLVVIPAVGGLLVGLLVHFFAAEARGHGVPEVMEAVLLRGGRIRPVVVLIKTLASALTIGSGGSAGREGPIVQIGAGFGSTLGQVLRLSDKRVRNLLACGAAAGIAATFNAPIAGVLFALEVILNEFTMHTFSTVVVSSVIATVVGTAMMGDSPAFDVPTYTLVSSWEILIYVGLGLACALVATLYILTVHGSEIVFGKLRLPPWAKPALGGLGVGAMALFAPEILGVGYEMMSGALLGSLGAGFLLGLVFLKIIATSLTLGSGGSGGVFAPSLFIGAMLGGSFGTVVHSWWPTVTAPSGAYALVGMAAVFSAMAKAPLTGIIILFEMTRSYSIILPLMFAVAIATILSKLIFKESIYSIKLKSRGINIEHGRDFSALGDIKVGEAMKPASRLTTVSPDLPIEEMARLFKETFHHGFAVTSQGGRLYGVITLQDMERALKSKRIQGKLVRDICTTRVTTAFPDETIEDVLSRFGALDVGRVPVIDNDNDRTLVGMLRWSDIVRSHTQLLLDLSYEVGTVLIRCDIAQGDLAEGKSLKDLCLPAEAVVNSIQRGRHLVVPRGNTVIEAGDKLVILASEGSDEQVNCCLYGQPTSPALAPADS